MRGCGAKGRQPARVHKVQREHGDRDGQVSLCPASPRDNVLTRRTSISHFHPDFHHTLGVSRGLDPALLLRQHLKRRASERRASDRASLYCGGHADTGREQLVGSKAAFQAVYTHDDTRIDLSSSVVDVVLRVRPAVFNGLLWVGELPDNADDAMLESVVNMHGQGPPDLCKVACSQCHAQSKDWGLVQFSTDETAATVLVRSWDTLVCANRLPWPALMEAWAPGEGTNHKFSLGLPDLPPAPPHFVFVNTLKWEFAHQWRRVTLAHRAQCEALRGAQWRERHELMGRKRGSAERERWSEGARDSRSGVTKLKGSLFVAKMRCPRAEDEAGLRDSPDSEWLEMNQLKRMKEMVKNFMSKYGMVDICRVTADSAGGLYSAKVQFGGGGCVAVAEAAMASLNSGGGAVFGVGVSASPLLLDKTICITELDTDVHNAALAEAFGQFGKIVMSTGFEPLQHAPLASFLLLVLLNAMVNALRSRKVWF